MAQQPARTYDQLFKILIIGDSGIGKTELMTKFAAVYPSQEKSSISRIGIDFMVRTVDIDGVRVKLQIWDTAGQERFRTITQSYYRGASGAVLAYDVRNRQSFVNINEWLRNVNEYRQSEDFSKILVGNYNNDPASKAVSTEEAQAFAEQQGLQLFEVHLEDKAQVEQAFLTLAKMILQTKKEKKGAAPITVGDETSTEAKCLI